MTRLLIFSDLDGTLLGHDDYCFKAALPALEKITWLEIPLILNSSKTLAEIAELRRQLGNQHPFVVENGAAIFIPRGYFPGYTQSLNPILLAGERSKFLPIIHALRKQHHFLFQGFADFNEQEIINHTGLDSTQAKNAAARIGTEPILWRDSEQRLQHFKVLLAEHKLRLVQGGRFQHIMGQTDKANAMHWLIARYRQHQPGSWLCVALGDSHNDKSMLEDADFSAVIRCHNGSHLQLHKHKSAVIYTNKPAPAGWQEAMDSIFQRLSDFASFHGPFPLR